MRDGRGSGACCQYWNAILSATSTAVEPLSEKNTRLSGPARPSREPGRDRDEPLRQLFGPRMGQAEHRRMGDPVELRAHRGVDVRVAVAVHVAPQRGDTIDVPASGRVDEPHAVGGLDRGRRLGLVALHLRERMPEVRDRTMPSAASAAEHLRDGSLAKGRNSQGPAALMKSLSSRDLPPLGLLVFVVGAASLGAEIAAARLMAPFFGASTIVWANVIGVVLVSLAVGYWLGGRFADRHPHKEGLCLLVLIAGFAVSLIPFAADPFLDVSVDALDKVSAGAFIGSLVAVTVLVAPPVMLLGAASPYALRLGVERVEEAGTVAGRLYAISTFGSLFGTFASALLLIPVIGTRRTFLVFGLACAVVALAGVRRRAAIAVPATIVALLALPVGTIKAAGDGVVLDEAETRYQYARVVEEPDGERKLELNEGQAVHSLYRPGTYLTGDYWDEFLVLPFAAGPTPPRSVAILGNAAGTTARALGRYFPAAAVDAVEIDSELTRLGRKWFDLRNPRMRVHHEDARPYLRRTDARYDAILVDVYRQPYIPFYLATENSSSWPGTGCGRAGR